MAIERKIVPYEVLIRFNFDPKDGPLGQFRGAHYIESEAVIDTETGELINYRPGQALGLANAADVAAHLDRLMLSGSGSVSK